MAAEPAGGHAPKPDYVLGEPEARVYVGDCRPLLERAVRPGEVDLIFADPPFNWSRDYDRWKAGGDDEPPRQHGQAAKEAARLVYDTWHDALPEREYLDFTFDWIDGCLRALRPGGSLWINIPDDWAAEIVVYLKGRLPRRPAAAVSLNNWCIWHYRFGQNVTGRFINSKVHALHFVTGGGPHTWNPADVLEPSDRATTYFDPRTQNKRDGMPPGMRVPMDVWYGPYWGRIQGNNTERRPGHDNQLPEVYLARVVLGSSNAGDLVLDPFLGSGTTGVVARALGRRFVGLEFSAANAASAVERMRAGPVRDLRSAVRASTAIFQPRGRRTGSGGDAKSMFEA